MVFYQWRSPVLLAAVAVFIPVSVFATTAWANGLSIKPGLWEVRTYTKMHGMPSDVPPVPARAKQCITQDMLEGESDLQLLVGRQDECHLSNRRQEESGGNAPTVWYMECENHNFRIRGDARLLPIAPTHYTGTLAFESDSPEESKAQGEIGFVGIRLGDCPKAD